MAWHVATDLCRAQLMVLMCKASWSEVQLLKIYLKTDFYMLVSLQRLGAKIKIKNNTATIEGNTKFIGAELMSSDLRASVALVSGRNGF